MLSALRQLMGQAANAGSLEAVYQSALRCLQEGLGVSRASLLLFDAGRTMRFVVWSRLSEEYPLGGGRPLPVVARRDQGHAHMCPGRRAGCRTCRVPPNLQA